MKKLSLKSLNLGANELLQREQLKTVFGGYGSCGYRHPNGSAWCNLSYSEAITAFNNYGGNWCCDSCG